MKYTVIGVRQLIENQQSYEHGSAEMVQYTIMLRDELGGLCSFKATNTYGDCGSGYTSATWGDFSGIVSEESIGALHFVPVRVLEGEFDMQKSPDYYGQEVTTFQEIDTGEIIVSHSGDGGDSYYPSGSATINEALFKPTPRMVERRKLYLFQGASGVGKSFLAENSTLKSYETDRSPELPKNLADYDIIVIGNKYKFETTDFKSLLKEASIDVVIVSFAGRN